MFSSAVKFLILPLLLFSDKRRGVLTGRRYLAGGLSRGCRRPCSQATLRCWPAHAQASDP